MVSEAAYNLFYRKRGAVDFGPTGEIDYSKVMQIPDIEPEP